MPSRSRGCERSSTARESSPGSPPARSCTSPRGPSGSALRLPDPALVSELEDEGYELAVFPPHPPASARPSRTDLANIGLWEDRPYLILSRPTGELLAWRIRGEAVEPLPLDEYLAT